MKTTFTRSVARTFVILVFIANCASSRGRDLADVLKHLQWPSGGMSGYKIAAHETNTVFLQGGKAQITASSYEYQFGDEVASISCRVFDPSGSLIRERRVLVAGNEVWEMNQTSEATTNPTSSPYGHIELLGDNVLYGVPVFLSKFLLYEFLTKSKDVYVDQMASTEKTLVIEIRAPTNAPIGFYRLFLDARDLRPVEFYSYLSDGTICSATSLSFEKSGDLDFICKKADAKIFAQGRLIIQYSWVFTAAEKPEVPLVADFEAFFPPHARISDRRFSKMLAYHKGRRMPTSNEIHQMLTTSNGVMKYEAASSLDDRREGKLWRGCCRR